ncbi:tetratricopeptide repeat protein [Miniphocaeibacter massiliensis]|uniref:tetratricopeptide repeat protein n=1 Tax=Miniphocaeibacter massiliensis TaxID=2041841 RepID=UPI000C07BB30|nr:hypothetical protein [Miniphocaeibacter massiliensis]
MENINNYYIDKREELLYLELKNNSEYKFPLPILKKDFVEEIKNDTFNEKIEFKYFFRGMIFNISVDPNFKYSKEYLTLLINKINKLEKTVLAESLLELKEDVEVASIFLKFNYDNFKDAESNYYYASTLLNLYSKNQEEYFKDKSEEVLNKNIVIDDTYPLTYLLLGDIEESKGNLVKAKLYYKSANKFINNLENNEVLLKELKTRQTNIEEEAFYSEIRESLKYSRYYEVVNKLENLEKEDFEKYYYLGNAYLGLTNYDEAFKNYELANSYKEKSIDFYVDYSYFLAEIGKVGLALEVIDEGLENHEDNEKLLFNRALIYININKIEQAREDLTNIVQYYDISEDIFNNSMILLEKIQDL